MLLGSLCINVLGLALPIIILQIYDRIVPNAAMETFALLMIGMAIVVIADAALRILRSLILSWSGAKFEHLESVRSITQILQGDTLEFESRSSGTYLEKISNLEKIREFFSGQAMLTLLDLPFVIVFAWLIWFITGPLVLVPVTLLALYSGISLYAANRMRHLMQSRSDLDERRQNFMIETLRGIHTVKSTAIEPLILRRYERLQGQSAESVDDISRISGINQGLAAILANVGTVSFVGIGSLFVVTNEITLGALAAGTMLTGRVIQPLLRAMGLWYQFQSVRIARNQLDELFEMKTESAYAANEVPTDWGRIELSDIRFSYPNVEEELLRGVSLSVQPGETIGITGGNGTGKSTLLSIIMGLFTPSDGRVQIDGRDIRGIEPEMLRSRIGYVPQKGVIYEGSILENMTLFREGEAIRNAIALANLLGLTELIAKLPAGLDTPIGGTAVDSLPEGLRQKIIIVRALVTDPDILLFDDANANFDLINDSRLLKVIKSFKGHLSIVIVTHRPSYLKICDRCFELQDGVLTTHVPFGASAPPPQSTAAPKVSEGLAS